MPKSPEGVATPSSIVDALKALAGNPPKARAIFAGGRCVRGTYAASDRAAEVTRSRSFMRPSRVLARFSVGGADAGMPGGDNGVLRGFSFRLGGNDHRSDILTQSVPMHYARTLDQMLACLKARRPTSDGRVDIKRLKAFAAANPETLHQAGYVAAHPPPATLAGTTYWGVHAFPATNSQGETRFIKFKVVPVGGGIASAGQGAMTHAAEFLLEELEHRIAAGDVRFSVMALLDRPDDPVMDVTIRWPDEDHREAVRLGTIVITGVESNETCDASIFDPSNLADGIGYPPDEIFAARRIAYAVALAQLR